MSDAESSVHLHIFVFVFNALKTIVILILILLFHKCNWLNTHDHWSLTSGRRVKLTHLWSLCCCVIIVTDHLPVVWISCFFNVVNWATQSWCWLYLLRQNFVNIAMGKHVTCQADHHIKIVTWKGCKSYLHECLDIVFSFFLRSLASRISIRSLKQYWRESIWQYFCLP